MHGENGHELLTDLYQLTMAQGYWETGQGATQACFHAYFRDYPFRGGYAIACGMDQLAELIEGFGFSAEDVEYLASLDAPGGGRLFKPAFLEYLRTFSLRVDVDAVAEGAVVFPHEPIVRVMGPIMDCQLIETALLNCVNFETLIATKAARVCLAAHGAPVAERPLRYLGRGVAGAERGALELAGEAVDRACGRGARVHVDADEGGGGGIIHCRAPLVRVATRLDQAVLTTPLSAPTHEKNSNGTEQGLTMSCSYRLSL